MKIIRCFPSQEAVKGHGRSRVLYRTSLWLRCPADVSHTTRSFADVCFTPSRPFNRLVLSEIRWKMYLSRMFHLSVLWRMRDVPLKTDSVRFVHMDVRFYPIAWNMSERERNGCFTTCTYKSEEYRTVKAWNFHRVKSPFWLLQSPSLRCWSPSLRA